MQQKINSEIIEQVELNNINTKPLPRDSQWEMNYLQLVKFKEEHGHLKINKTNKKYAKLGRWTSYQRKSYKEGNLKAERIEKLEYIGFDWTIEKKLVSDSLEEWERCYKELLEYKAEFGHLGITYKEPKYKELIKWSAKQRMEYREHKLSEYKINKLEEAGFVWSFTDGEPSERWKKKYNDLLEYKSKHGHMKVAWRDSEHQSLNSWMLLQRNSYKHNQLSEQKIKLLESIGFQWSTREAFYQSVDARWEEKYNELIAYKEKFGHMSISVKNPEMVSLARWVEYQRRKYEKNKLSDDKVARLNSIGFVWVPR